MYHDFSYPAVLSTAGKRTAWQIDDVLPADARLDFTQPFMPRPWRRRARYRG